MSATAGKVMPRPMGDYNAATEYTVLDIVIYNNRPYMAKQTTQGNLPTNTTYWLLLLDFPTEVDNVPTENSQNLVRSGGVYNVTADKMKADGSNATALALGPSTKTSFMSAAISKDSGASQDVTLIYTVPDGDSHLARNITGILNAHIGDNVIYSDSSVEIKVTISSVTKASDDSVVTVVGSLVDDVTEAISLSKMTYFYAYNNGSPGDLASGAGAAVKSSGAALGYFASSADSNTFAIGNKAVASGSNSFATGEESTAAASTSFAEGYRTLAFGAYSHAEGNHTRAFGTGSHSSGQESIANGDYSFAAGQHTYSAYDAECSIGKYNTNYSMSGKKSLFNVGNGSSNASSNAFTVYEDGFISVGSGHNRFKFTQNNGVWGFYDDDNVFHNVGNIRLTQSVTLSTSGDTTVTFSNAAITNDSVIEPLTSVWGLIPTTVTTTTGSCVLTFAKAASADTVTVGIDIS